MKRNGKDLNTNCGSSRLRKPQSAAHIPTRALGLLLFPGSGAHNDDSLPVSALDLNIGQPLEKELRVPEEFTGFPDADCIVVSTFSIILTFHSSLGTGVSLGNIVN